MLLNRIYEEATLNKYVRVIIIAIFGSVVIAASAPLSYHISFSVIPFTVQVHVALLVAYLLGRFSGPLAVFFFILEGLAGFPVFSGGAAGIINIFGPRGGYLVGYFVASCVIGLFDPRSLIRLFFTFATANAVVYFFGVMWLVNFMGTINAVKVGVIPFLLGDLIKLLMVSKLAFILRKDYFLN